MNKLKNFFFKKLVYIPLIAIILIVVGVISYKATHQPVYTTTPAVKQDFVQVISSTGKVVPADNVDLNFESSGKIGKVNVKIGDSVKKGQVLATLGSGDAYASLLGAQARLETEQIKLANLQAGNRPEEVALKQSTATQSENTLVTDITNSYLSSDDLNKTNIDPLFHRNGDLGADIIPFGDAALKKSLDERKIALDQTLKDWAESISKLQASGYSTTYLNETLTNLATLQSFLSDLAIATSEMTPVPDLSQATIDQYKAGVSASRSTVNTSINTLNSAKDALQTAEQELSLSQAGSNPFDIQAQQAVVQSAEASVLSAEAGVGKTVISAPFDGIVTKVDITAGGVSSLSTPAISLISAAEFQIESFIPEADIAKIHLGDKANITLDAYGSNTIFEAVVSQIDPAETVIEGVSTYRTILQFTAHDDRIKSGMTANIDIQGQVRQGVLTIPQGAVLYDDNNNKTVYILKAGEKNPEIRTVQIGQTDDKGNIEVISGISEGESVVTNPPRK